MEDTLFLFIIMMVYLFAVGYLAYRGYRGTKNATDYLIAGRNAHPFVMALSYGATFISTSAIVGFGGAAAVFGLGGCVADRAERLCGYFCGICFYWRPHAINGPSAERPHLSRTSGPAF